MNIDDALIPFAKRQHRESLSASSPAEGKPAHSDDERSPLQIDPECLASERPIGRDIDEGASLQKIPYPIETAEPGLRIPVGEPDHVTRIERRLPTRIVRGRFKSSRKFHRIPEGSKSQPRLRRPQVKTEQDGTAREGAKMLFASNHHIAA